MDDTRGIGETLHRLMHAYKRALREQYEHAGIALSVSHIRVLKGVCQQHDASAQHIARRMRQDKGRIARLIKTLVAEGLVSRAPDPDDSRRQRLRPTAAGTALRGRIAELEARAGTRMAAGLSGEALTQFAALAETMVNNLENSEERTP